MDEQDIRPRSLARVLLANREHLRCEVDDDYDLRLLGVEKPELTGASGNVEHRFSGMRWNLALDPGQQALIGERIGGLVEGNRLLRKLASDRRFMICHRSNF